VPDRFVYTLRTAIASNTGGPFTAIWDRVPVAAAGTIRSVVAVSPAIASNVRYNQVDVYYQSDAPSVGSNTATSVLTTPINLLNTNDAIVGVVSQAGARIAEGGQLQLRTYSDNLGAQPAFTSLAVSVLVEPDAT